VIRDYLEQDDYQVTWLLERLRNMGYTGSYETLRDYIRPLKEQKTRMAYIRFETEPGRQGQIDLGDFQVQEADGRVTTLHAFALVLGFSRAMHVEFSERCTLESFLDCHLNGFRYLGGVPAELLYDNMKQVVIDRRDGKANFNIESCTLPTTAASNPRSARLTAPGSRARSNAPWPISGNGSGGAIASPPWRP
jgi:transposase